MSKYNQNTDVKIYSLNFSLLQLPDIIISIINKILNYRNQTRLDSSDFGEAVEIFRRSNNLRTFRFLDFFPINTVLFLAHRVNNDVS